MDAYSLLKDENYMIGIPTRARTHLIDKKVGVWKYFLREPFNKKEFPVVAFVRESEREMYREALKGTYVEIVVVSDEINIATKRNLIYKHARTCGKEHVFIVNDDVDFYFRKEELSSKYTNKYDELMEKKVVEKIFLECIYLCNSKFPISGLPLKQGSQDAKYWFEKNRQIIHLQCYHVPTLEKEEIEHDGMGVCGMSDRWVQLSLHERGYRTVSNFRYAVGDMGTGRPGGCTEFRTPELVTEAARAVKERFPEVTQLKRKANGVWDTPRIDCTIRLKKYLEEGEQPFIPSVPLLDKWKREKSYNG